MFFLTQAFKGLSITAVLVEESLPVYMWSKSEANDKEIALTGGGFSSLNDNCLIAINNRLSIKTKPAWWSTL